MIAGLIAASISIGGTPDLTIRQAERLAVQHSTEIRSARDALKSAWALAGRVEAKTRPQIGLSGTASRFDDRTAVPFGGTEFEMLGNHNEELSLQLVQVLDLSNQLGTAHAQARLAAMSDSFALLATISDQILTTDVAFINVLRAKQGVGVAEATLTAYREQLRTVTELWEQGVGQRIDVHRATSQVASAEKDLVERQNDLALARSVLNDQLGYPLSEDVALNEAGFAPEGAPNTAGEFEALATYAGKHRSECKAATLAVVAATKGIKLARSDYEPTFYVALTGNYYPTTSFSYPRQSVGALTLGVSIPIFDGGEARARAQEARATVDSAKAQQDHVQRLIALQVQQALLNLHSARRALEAAAAALQSATAAKSLALQRFQNQVGIYLEVTDAQAALAGAQASQIAAKYDVEIARAQLARAIGDLEVPATEESKS